MSELLWGDTVQHLLAGPGLPVAEKVLRPVIVYAALVVLLRVFGKRELAQLNPFDLVVLLSLSNTVQNAIIGDDNTVSGGLLGAVALLAANYVVVRFMFKHRRLDQLLEGEPTTLVERGAVCEAALARELLTVPELQTMAHRQGFAKLEDVETCVLEPGGTFFIEGRTPPPDERRHRELLERIEQLSRQIEEMKRSEKK
ncbi:MAG TPA: YetF domain-containing protein [Pyrinomonadaceae bacterium]|nr:YetF domain-containing protein [Pyrinomonadaceae bacterium]